MPLEVYSPPAFLPRAILHQDATEQFECMLLQLLQVFMLSQQVLNVLQFIIDSKTVEQLGILQHINHLLNVFVMVESLE